MVLGVDEVGGKRDVRKQDKMIGRNIKILYNNICAAGCVDVTSEIESVCMRVPMSRERRDRWMDRMTDNNHMIEIERRAGNKYIQYLHTYIQAKKKKNPPTHT